MNRISPLDIRVAVLAQPYVSKEEQESAANLKKPVAPSSGGDDRIVSVFQNSPKPRLELNRSNIPLILRKGQLAIFRTIEILKSWMQPQEESKVWEEIRSPRTLYVPQLPHPPFQSAKPARFFWHPAYVPPQDEYAPSCLISESKEEREKISFNSPEINAYAHHLLPKQGILRQNHEGFVYLELPDDYITAICPLIQDRECEAVPLYRNNMKNRDFGKAGAQSLNQRSGDEAVQLEQVVRCRRVQNLGCPAQPKTDSSYFFGIYQLEPSPAHIPVILPHEWNQKKGWGACKDLEQTIPFEITGLYSLKPKAWPGIERVYFFEIESKALEDVRERSLLPSRIRGHKFHVAIAFKKTVQPQAPNEIFRLNVSCFAA